VARLLHRVLATALTLLLVALLGCADARPAAAADGSTDAATDGDDTMPRPDPGRPWFGPELDIETAVPQDYARALGATPSSFTFQVDYPVGAQDRTLLERQVGAIATLGSVVVLDLQPRAGLEGLERGDAEDLGRLLDALHDELGTWFLARFAAEMNGSWEPWGQQPEAFVAAFRELAAGLAATAPHVETVWSPVYGSGYPYLDADGARDLSQQRASGPLDTNGDKRLTGRDDPYGPYFPGDDVVDWVGLTLYRFGQDQGIDRNVVPRGEYTSRLAETWGYGDRAGRESFYERFAADGDRPMLVQTSALYNPAVPGASELALKRSWWRQVFGESASHPLIGLISWLEVDRVEPEVDTSAVDWRVTADPEIAAAIRADLGRSTVDLGPVSTPVEDTSATGGRSGGGGGGAGGRTAPDPTSDVVPALTPDPTARGLAGTAAALLLVLLLVVVVTRSPRRRGAGVGASADNGDDHDRDPGLDAVRGLLVLLAVAGNVVALLGERGAVREVLGSLPVPEGLVVVSGIALATTVAVPVVRRALTLYLAAVLTALGVHVVSVLPGVDLGALTSVTDPDTGERRHLFPDADRLFDYPTPWGPARRLLLLEMGPWATSMLGLFVLLALATPLVLAVVRRRWWLALVLSWAVWGLGQAWHPDWSPAQVADAFPPLAWQVLFVHGLVLGHHRRTVGGWLVSRAAAVVAAVAALACGGLAAWWLLADHAPDPDWFAGVDLPAGRLLVVGATGAVAAIVALRGRPRLTTRAGGVLPFVGRHAVAVGLGHVVVLVLLAATVA
jgi:hypothetical protein